MASVHYLCSKCDARLARAEGDTAAACDRCGTPSNVLAPPSGSPVTRCAACDHDELYVQKDFNRTTGITLVAVGAIFVPWTYGLSLLGVTILDYIVWRMVKNVIVCYACQTVHRGYTPGHSIKLFDLATHDRHVYGAAPPGAEEQLNMDN